MKHHVQCPAFQAGQGDHIRSFRHGHGTLQAVTNNLEVVLDLLVRKVVTLAFFNDTEFNLALKLLFIQRGSIFSNCNNSTSGSRAVSTESHRAKCGRAHRTGREHHD